MGKMCKVRLNDFEKREIDSDVMENFDIESILGNADQFLVYFFKNVSADIWCKSD
jgi:hypothetical protein